MRRQQKFKLICPRTRHGKIRKDFERPARTEFSEVTVFFWDGPVDTVLRAIATYQRTRRSGWSSFDDWVQGDETAISEAAKSGFDLFMGEAIAREDVVDWVA